MGNSYHNLLQCTEWPIAAGSLHLSLPAGAHRFTFRQALAAAPSVASTFQNHSKTMATISSMRVGAASRVVVSGRVKVRHLIALLLQ